MDGIQTVLKFLVNWKTAIGYSFMALLTVGSERLFSLVAFKCPCSNENFIYGLVFLFAPAWVLLIIGYFMNSRMWKLFTGCCLNPRKIFPKGNSCRFFYIFGQITLNVLIAPVMWLSVALLNGTFYECAMSGLKYPGYVNTLCKNKSDRCWKELHKVSCGKTTMSSSESEELKLMLQAQSQRLKSKILSQRPSPSCEGEEYQGRQSSPNSSILHIPIRIEPWKLDSDHVDLLTTSQPYEDSYQQPQSIVQEHQSWDFSLQQSPLPALSTYLFWGYHHWT
ncbi:calcium homeostasis modulator protein 5-like isoform X4 [Carettochelys insculpta]|uniref:calcium homeostasis modulator protein 5-like isoform X4 n=1 Tax=Carettochelys insculpta TaxID=44489 RepID=UPI003EC116CC